MNRKPCLIGYLRTSTDDQQSPEDSAAWQKARIADLTGTRAEVIAYVHDTDTSRAVPWERRDEAGRLLTELMNPARDWDGIVVGETARAFGNAMQVQLVLLQMSHFGAQLWVPEVGGPVDPDSEAHDMMLNMFGGLSKAERQRLKIRVRASMRQVASTGRWLGGRPPYGYRLISTGLPHPNPELARYGVQLHQLDIDPEKAPAVVSIFEMRAQGLGWRPSPAGSTISTLPVPLRPTRAATPTGPGGAGLSALSGLWS